MDATDEAPIELSPTPVFAVEMYSPERIAEFAESDALPADLEARAKARFADLNKENPV